MTLKQQYKKYMNENPDGSFTFEEWVDWQASKFIPALSMRSENELPYSLVWTINWIVNELKQKDIWYEGDISDLGNEIGYAVGKALENMTEQETTDFIHGIRHGISLTNGTH